MEKTCTKCHQVKPLSLFCKRYGSRVGQYRSYCKACHSAYTSALKREGRKSHPERFREDPIKRALRNARRDKNTQEVYVNLLKQQGGVCAICGKPETLRHQSGKIRSLARDHNHQTGEFRGLLCFRCNTTLAKIEDESFVSAAQAYLVSRQ